jgi:phage baseplate assembly protein W
MFKFYKGFSTRNYAKTGKGFELYNVELIEEDLLNEIYTLRGERIMMPSFGTRVPLMVMEPNDTQTLDILKADI